MRTNTWDGPHCSKRGANQFWSSPIASIPCAPSWVSKTPNDIWFWNTVGLYIDTSRLKWIFWTSHQLVLLIDMLLKLSRNLSTRTNGSSGLQIHNNQNMKNTTLTNNLPKTSPSHRKRRVMGRQRRTPENGLISTKAPSTTPMNVAQSLWYPTWCARYGRYWWTLKLLGPSLVVVWSISCTSPHSCQQGNIVPLPHPQKNPKWDRPHIFQNPLWKFSFSKFPTNV